MSGMMAFFSGHDNFFQVEYIWKTAYYEDNPSTREMEKILCINE
jgi:hypothetical protein